MGAQRKSIVLLVVAALLSVGLVMSSASAAPEPVAQCAVARNAEQLMVTWDAVSGADRYVVYRSVDGGTAYWRGATETLSLTDADRPGTMLLYSVRTKDASGLGSAVECDSSVPPPSDPVPPSTCTTSVAGDTVSVSWPNAEGATRYVVFRRVDGSGTYWRGATSDLSFADSNRPGTVMEYSVRSKVGSQLSEPVTCGSDSPPPPPAIPPESCEVSVGASEVLLSWSEVPGATKYVVYRTVDGGSQYWRGAPTEPGFVDSPRPGAALVYTVRTKIGSALSEPVTCEAPTDLFSVDALVVGDIASCAGDNAAAVAGLLDGLSGPIWAVGDIAYPDGSVQQFAECFDPKFGRHRDRFHPVPGNHEYDTPGAAGYFDYFGAQAGDPTKGYYAETVGEWKVLFLNSNCSEVGGCYVVSPQFQWMQAEIAGIDANSCLAVVAHHPRWSSYEPYASQEFLDPMMKLLDDNGLDLLLAGHSHFYERLGRTGADYGTDAATGFRQFTVGTGGIPLRPPAPGTTLSISERVIEDSYGVLALDLNEDSYGWRFLETGGTILDQGSETCRNG